MVATCTAHSSPRSYTTTRWAWSTFVPNAVCSQPCISFASMGPLLRRLGGCGATRIRDNVATDFPVLGVQHHATALLRAAGPRWLTTPSTARAQAVPSCARLARHDVDLHVEHFNSVRADDSERQVAGLVPAHRRGDSTNAMMSRCHCRTPPITQGFPLAEWRFVPRVVRQTRSESATDLRWPCNRRSSVRVRWT